MELREKQLVWARKHLPAAHPPFVAVAINSLRFAKVDVTLENVKGRLAHQGRLGA